jgi:hypothetical protein
MRDRGGEDEVIERLQRLERLLEQVARTLVRQWEVLASLAREAAQRTARVNEEGEQPERRER